MEGVPGWWMKRKANDEGKEIEFGGFEKNTKGFGMKMLLKMGYKLGTGLGREGEGRVNPIEIKLRTRNTGLGFDHDEEKPVNARLTINTVEEANDGLSVQTMRRGKKGLDEELAEIKARLSSPIVKILDFTGEQVRKVSSLSETAFRSPRQHSRFPELLHNLSVLVNMTEREWQNSIQTKTRDEQTLLRLEEEERKLSAEIEVLERQKTEIDKLTHLMFEGSSLMKSPRDPIESYRPWLRKSMGFIRDESLGEEHRLMASGMIVGVLIPMLRHTTSSSELADQSLIDQWKELRQLVDFACTTDHWSPYEQLFAQVMLAELRSVIMQSLKAHLDSLLLGANIFFLWSSIIPKHHLNFLATSSVLPALTRLLDNWTIKDSQQLPLHSWLIPWITSLSSFLDQPLNSHYRDLFSASIRRKLANAIQQKNEPLDDESLATLMRWRPPVLASQEFDLLLGRVVLPNLEALLASTLTVNPTDQDITPIETVVKWSQVTPVDVVGALLAKYLFPKLLDCLQEWMSSPDADYEEIVQWYLAWKNLFPPPLLATAIMQNGLNNLLATMNKLLDQ